MGEDILLTSSPFWFFKKSQTISCIAAFAAGQFGITAESNSLGVLFPGLEARIVREDGSDADYDELGELLVHGQFIYLLLPLTTTNQTFE